MNSNHIEISVYAKMFRDHSAPHMHPHKKPFSLAAAQQQSEMESNKITPQSLSLKCDSMRYDA